MKAYVPLTLALFATLMLASTAPPAAAAADTNSYKSTTLTTTSTDTITTTTPGAGDQSDPNKRGHRTKLRGTMIDPDDAITDG